MADSQKKSAQILDLSTWYNTLNVASGTKELISGGFKLVSTGGDTYTGEAFKTPSSVPSYRQPQLIEVKAETTYTLSTSALPKCYISYVDSSYNVLNNGYIRMPVGTSYTFTTPSNTKYIIFRMGKEMDAGEEVSFSNIMLNEGSQPRPYEPYSPTGWLHSLRKLTTATEAVENPLYSDGTAITAYTIKGNEEHTGTPSPQNPVMPNGVGVRTENIAEDIINNTSIAQYVIVLKIKAELQSNTTYTLSFNAPAGLRVYTNEYLFARVNYVTVEGLNTIALTTLTVDKTDTRQYQDGYFNILKNTNTQSISVTLTDIMVNSGSTAKPYEPYGYKIPISSGGVTTNIYLGSTQTVRVIKKYVFTGQETMANFVETTDQQNYCAVYRYSDIGWTDILDYDKSMKTIEYPVFVSSHFKEKTTGRISYKDIQDGECGANDTNAMNRYIILCVAGIATANDFKIWLQTQYQNGTPVTVWYVLATPTTGIVNEPLMKIGDYADTLSNAASIPTTEGANSISVDTTVQPSEFTATWTGWHNATVKEWDGSQWQ